MAFCMRSDDKYQSALFQFHQKLSVILWRDVIVLFQPEQVRRLLIRNVFSHKTSVGQRNDLLQTAKNPCCQRYCRIVAFQEIVRVQANTKYFRQTSILKQCRPRPLLRNWSKAPNVHPQIFMRHQHLRELPTSTKALDFHHGGNLPCQVTGRDHRHLERSSQR